MGEETDKKYPFEVVLCGGVRTYFALRKGRLLKGGSTMAEGVKAMAGRYDVLERYWFGALERPEALVVCGYLGITEEEAKELIQEHKRAVRAKVAARHRR